MEEFFGVAGAGGWGTALALVMARKGFKVKMWVRSEESFLQIKGERENKRYLPGVILPENIELTRDLEEVAARSKLLVIALPSHAFRDIVSRLKTIISRDSLLVSATKGLEKDTLQRMSQVIEEELGTYFFYRSAVLSGPNHAEEVAREIPSATVVASKKRDVAERAQDVFMSPSFRVYTNPDLVGVELGGALKNIIALGSGISDGLGYGDNTRAALMTRGLLEISRLGVKMGARPLTFAGLAGIGDLIATCTSQHSRNRRAGIMLGEGKKHEEVLQEMKMVVEGIKTSHAAVRLAEIYNIEMPITNEVFQVIFQDKDPRQAVADLMRRVKKNEMEEIVETNIEEW
ncbi:MAG: NAD(P)H-dependent glycerol-3-phosphate dehydrogenase [Candidatus Syntrophonatronum acetioxidans]|uniref:Glycerol-3-phosphate dehydrogenase [NAD(P)+] n=1 Tax=Candidatus Syntrophonatronum acetioxidans TaxID=1795816 RepID=A0A424YC04_9FIRM|nr:MAG: NAD(P)H-dependent glycerol-3-phosphate dehydrogenase [Candidatus Syntrophonatronum acetioxidans]